MTNTTPEIYGFFDFEDIYGEAVRDAVSGARFVEIGCLFGKSTAFLAKEIQASGKRISLTAIDPWTHPMPELMKSWLPLHLQGCDPHANFLANMAHAGVAELVCAVRDVSVSAARRFEDASLDFVFIDGDHAYDAVAADIQAWLPKLKIGGVLAGHDYGHSSWPGVGMAVNDNLPLANVQRRGSCFWYRKETPAQGRWVVPLRSEGADSLIYIPFINRLDLLDRAVASIRAHWKHLVILDQSDEGIGARWDAEVAVYRMAPRLQFSAMMNWAADLGRERGVRYLCFMHNDAECVADAAATALQIARERDDGQLGVLLTNYDAFSVFVLSTLRRVGCWDESFPWYVSDVDFYHRVRRAGLRIENAGDCALVRHDTSQTWQAMPRADAEKSVHRVTRWAHDHYRHKWGGDPGHEVHTVPYNEKP